MDGKRISHFRAPRFRQSGAICTAQARFSFENLREFCVNMSSTGSGCRFGKLPFQTMQILRNHHIRFSVAALYVLVTVLFGFAHRPLSIADTGVPTDLAQYALPDGSIPTICVTDGAEGKSNPSKRAIIICDACLVSASSLDTAASPTLQVPPPVPHVSILPGEEEIPPARLVLWSSPRGPPVLPETV